jgi:hypothetical protein
MSAIFLSYRRADEPAATRLVREHLTQVFGEQAIFYDIETMPQGEDFVAFIERTIRACTVMLVVIGPHWLEAQEQRGPRLWQPDDPIRFEIETALRLNKRLIPVLINDAGMPERAALPPSIVQLHRQNAAPLHTNQYFKPDLERLIAAITWAGVPPLAAGSALPPQKPPAQQRRPLTRLFRLLPWLLRAVGLLVFAAFVLYFVQVIGLVIHVISTPSPTEQAIQTTVSGFCTALHTQHYEQAYTYLTRNFQRSAGPAATLPTHLTKGPSGELVTVVGCRRYSGGSGPTVYSGAGATASYAVDFDIRNADGTIYTLNARSVYFVYEDNAWKIGGLLQ